MSQLWTNADCRGVALTHGGLLRLGNWRSCQGAAVTVRRALALAPVHLGARWPSAVGAAALGTRRPGLEPGRRGTCKASPLTRLSPESGSLAWTAGGVSSLAGWRRSSRHRYFFHEPRSPLCHPARDDEALPLT